MKQKKELKKGSMGTTGLVCGLIGLFVFPIVFSPLAIIFSAIGLNKKEKYSVAGLVLGIIGVFYMFLMIVYLMELLLNLF